MPAECGRRTRGADGISNCAANGFLLIAPGNCAEDYMSVEKSRYGNGERPDGYLAERRETSIIDLLLPALRIEFDDPHGEWIVEIGRWIVEGEMTIGPDAATDNINRRSAELRGVAGGGARRIVGGLDQMHGGEVEMVEDGPAQPEPETLWRIGGQVEILVHMECGDARPIDALLFTERGKHLALTGRSGEDHSHAGLALKACPDFV